MNEAAGSTQGVKRMGESCDYCIKVLHGMELMEVREARSTETWRFGLHPGRVPYSDWFAVVSLVC